MKTVNSQLEIAWNYAILFNINVSSLIMVSAICCFFSF